jgi:phospholipase C
VSRVEEPNISAWRRANTGDMTSALRLRGPSDRGRSFPALPGIAFTRDYLLTQYVNSQDQNNPVIPTVQTPPTQEPGSRPHTP